VLSLRPDTIETAMSEQETAANGCPNCGRQLVRCRQRARTWQAEAARLRTALERFCDEYQQEFFGAGPVRVSDALDVAYLDARVALEGGR